MRLWQRLPSEPEVGVVIRKKRSCSICRHWFLPDVRAGERQQVCSQAACQRERHRRRCAEFNARERDAVAADRLTAQLQVALPEPVVDSVAPSAPRQPIKISKQLGKGAPPPKDWPKTLSWSVVQDAVGLKVAIVIAEYSKHLVFALKTQSSHTVMKLQADLQNYSSDTLKTQSS